MSIKNISLVQSRLFGSATRKGVAIKLADHASDDGSSVYPSLARIADEAELNKRTVRRTLRDFEREGLIHVVSPGGKGPKNTTEYCLDLKEIERLPVAHKKADTTPVLGAKRRTLDTAKGDTAPPEPSKNHQLDSLERESNNARASKHEFEELFWPAYPHKVGKAAAWRAYRTARGKVNVETIIDGVRRYVASKPPDRSWCNPATFLNQDRWLDEPSPIDGTNSRAAPKSGLSAALDRLDRGEEIPK